MNRKYKHKLERSVLGIVISYHSKHHLKILMEQGFKPNDFTGRFNAELFTLIQEFDSKNMIPDIVSLAKAYTPNPKEPLTKEDFYNHLILLTQITI